MRVMDASRRSALSCRTRRRRTGALFSLALVMLMVIRLPTCHGRVNAESREADVQSPSAPVGQPVRDQRIGEGKCTRLEIARSGRALIEVQIAAFGRGETRPRRHARGGRNAAPDE